VNSLIDLAKQEQKKPIRIDEKLVDLMDITGPIPSYYFPVASYENLIEKVNEFYRIKTVRQQPSGPPIFGAGPRSTQVQTSFPQHMYITPPFFSVCLVNYVNFLTKP
jgi:hypothetical protein